MVGILNGGAVIHGGDQEERACKRRCRLGSSMLMTLLFRLRFDRYSARVGRDRRDGLRFLDDYKERKANSVRDLDGVGENGISLVL